MFFKIALIVLFTAATVYIGLYFRKRTKSTDDFILGDRNVGPWLSAFAYGTTYFSATIFIGFSGQFGWGYGISAFWIGLGNALIGSLMAWKILGRRTRVMTKHLSAATMPEFFAKRFNSRAIKIGSSVIIFIFLVPYTSSVYKGLSGLFAMSFGIDFFWCIIGMAVLTGIFVVAGGYIGTAVNNFLQGIIMLIGILMVVAAVLNGQGGFTEAINRLSQIKSEAAPELSGAFVSMFGPDPIGLLSVIILTSIGTWGLPQMVHKFYAIKDEKAIKKGTVISTVFAIVVAGGSYFIGAFGRLYYTAEKIAFDDIVPSMISQVMPDAAIGIVLIAVLSASISTLAALVMASSSTLVIDFLKTFKTIKNNTQLLLIRLLCAVFIVISVIPALIPNNLITSLMSLSWGVMSGAFIGPFLYGLFWKGTTSASVWISMIFSIGFVVSNAFIKFTTPTIAAAAAMLASMIIVPLISLITPKLSKEHIQNTFSCYDEIVTVHRAAMIEEEVK